MHFEFLTEDQSGKVMLELLLPELLPEADGHTFNVHFYKGIGRIPKGMRPTADANKRILLDQIPRLLAGYGKAFAKYGSCYPAAVIVVCDLDDRNKARFEAELKALTTNIRPCPAHAFCLAIEEGEAWFLGDPPAIRSAYPYAKTSVMKNYEQDSICGTWELLADAVYHGGSETLKKEGWRRIGQEKSNWAQNITPHMQPGQNKSPSFNQFIKTVRKLSVD
ncbi:MAG: DUF4276 family protein [Verrucomicrobia bacterium]|nr:DUF4276 family protein [Verrucomicrobiota bacterium]